MQDNCKITNKETVKRLVSEDKGYMFMKTVNSTPAYWKNLLYDVLAMAKQIDTITLFNFIMC